MGMTNRRWECPYVQYYGKPDGVLTLRCEGGVLVFPDYKAAAGFFDRHCSHDSGWKKCAVAGMLNQYYARKDEYHV